MLSAKELFKYRLGLDKAVPQRGGDKDFMPDGSWLQNKRIEKYHEERENVLAEPRVQRTSDLVMVMIENYNMSDWVKGEWMPDRQLVELHHAMRNFWVHMGFVDNKRKWLYPEEALFLMETNVLEVWYHGLPLVIQQAYSMFLGGLVTPEYYQVYSHLRRIGYVVLRYQGKLNITKYERKIGLDKYLSNKERKKAQKRRAEQNKATETEENSVPPAKHVNIEISKDQESEGEISGSGEIIGQPDVNCAYEIESKKHGDEGQDNKGEEIDDQLQTESEDITVETGDDKQTVSPTVSIENNSSSKLFESVCVEQETMDTSCSTVKAETAEKLRVSDWNFDEIVFPNFGSSESIITVKKPDKMLLPGNFELSSAEYTFDKNKYINTKRREKSSEFKEVEKLQFSYTEIMTGWHNTRKSCKNWTEYKQHVQREMECWDRSHDLPNIYGDQVEPLVKPEDATSTGSVLDQLHVVKEESPVLNTSNSRPQKLPDFDVYTPDMKFKKSRPGVPDHRVCVTRCYDALPDLATITAIDAYLKDDAPLHWAVVDSGDIAFYVLSDFVLPQDITMG